MYILKLKHYILFLLACVHYVGEVIKTFSKQSLICDFFKKSYQHLSLSYQCKYTNFSLDIYDDQKQVWWI